MIRERVLQSFTFTPGGSQSVDLPRDAIYHIFQVAFTGTLSNVQAASTGTGCVLADDFPFSLLKNLRLVRNGSDVVFQGTGGAAALEHLVLNETAPHARLYKLASNVETLLTSGAALAIGGKGITVPANSEGIACRQVQFATNTNAGNTETVNFEAQFDIFLQCGPDDIATGTLIDARRLATFQLIFDYANVADVVIPGTGNTNTITATGSITAYDQDALARNINFGTFKRSQLPFSNLPYGSNNNQLTLPRGNYFHGILFETFAQKSNSTTVLSHENGVITQVFNRINSNFQLRQFTWEGLQRKNIADGVMNNAFAGSRGGGVNGCAYLYYPMTKGSGSELVPTKVMDTFDLQVSLAPIASLSGASTGINGPENGVTTASTNPLINLMLEEIIPGVSVGGSYPNGATAGSIAPTTASV